MKSEHPNDTWIRASRRLLAKIVSELIFDEIICAASTLDGYELALDEGVIYTFRAKRHAYGMLKIETGSIYRRSGPTIENAWDPLRFIVDARTTLGVSSDTAAHLIRELISTISADCRWLDSADGRSSELLDAGFLELEGYQTGHPRLIANKGRLGFSADDLERYAPESRRPLKLLWIAVHSSIATYNAVTGLDAECLLRTELGDETIGRFSGVLERNGGALEDYILMPVHPWQWDFVVRRIFAEELYAGRIVLLGEGNDRYLPQQPIRTLGNVDDPGRYNVKLPLMIFNTSVWRGLPTARTLAAPSLTQWLLGVHAKDPFFSSETRVVFLGEVAVVGVLHSSLDKVVESPYQYRELLGVLWRQPVESALDPGERARTLASLLYVDQDGVSFMSAVVASSGLAPIEWLRRFMHSLMQPLLHLLYRYGMAFCPHGENIIVIFDGDNVPTRIAMKDFIDDTNMYNSPLSETAEFPADAKPYVLEVSGEDLCQHIQSPLFLGVLRYLGVLADQFLEVSECEFWSLVRDEVRGYQLKFPESVDRFEVFDLLAPRHKRLCTNRNRLHTDAYRDLVERTDSVEHGLVENPLHVCEAAVSANEIVSAVVGECARSMPKGSDSRRVLDN
jgi:siderophore synthetase component